MQVRKLFTSTAHAPPCATSAAGVCCCAKSVFCAEPSAGEDDEPPLNQPPTACPIDEPTATPLDVLLARTILLPGEARQVMHCFLPSFLPSHLVDATANLHTHKCRYPNGPRKPTLPHQTWQAENPKKLTQLYSPSGQTGRALQT